MTTTLARAGVAPFHRSGRRSPSGSIFRPSGRVKQTQLSLLLRGLCHFHFHFHSPHQHRFFPFSSLYFYLSRGSSGKFGRMVRITRMPLAVSSVAPLDFGLLLSGWWDEINESAEWQDGIFYALCAAYALVSSVALVSSASSI